MAVLVQRLDDLESLKSKTWSDRLERGEKTELDLDAEMRKRNIHFIRQTPVHRETEDERHWPDLLAIEFPGVLWQVKDGRRSGPHDYVIAQDASMRGCENAVIHGAKVIIMWEMPNGTFVGDYVSKLIPMGALSLKARKNGSGTPGTKYLKYVLRPLDILLNELQKPEIYMTTVNISEMVKLLPLPVDQLKRFIQPTLF
jgi:hypothetical protein